MRIDFLITELNVGGAEKALTEIALGMKQRGSDVRVLSIGSQPNTDRFALVDRLQAEKVPVEFGGFDRWPQFLGALRWLSSRWRSSKPELVQSFLFHANCLAAAATRRTKVTKLVGGVRVAESRHWRCLLERRAVARMDYLTCVSSQVESFARANLGVSQSRSVVIPNGVAVSEFESAEPMNWSQLGWPGDSQVALFVGRFHPQKGLELIQRYAQDFLAGAANRRLLLVGEGPLGDQLRAWSSADPRTQVLPWQKDVKPFLRAAAMLLLPSHFEGMPNVILEAMASRLPVVCSRVEGSRELLCDEASDWRAQHQGFAAGDGASMCHLIESLYSDPDLGARLGEANHAHVSSRFSTEKMVQRYADLYMRLAN